jgi:hypothetical protein
MLKECPGALVSKTLTIIIFLVKGLYIRKFCELMYEIKLAQTLSVIL